jgi:transcriptional regulator with XRE-family HTH domain
VTPEEKRAEGRKRRLKHLNTLLGYRVGQAIKRYRKENKVTNKELAEQFGCSSATVSKWCGMNNDMRLDSFLTVVYYLDLDVHELAKNTKWEGI